MGSGPVTRTVVLTNRYGLHARPAAMFVEMCNRFQSSVRVSKDGTEVNGKNILDVMMLGAEPGSTLVLSIDGPDADSAGDQLVALIEGNFGEGEAGS